MKKGYLILLTFFLSCSTPKKETIEPISELGLPTPTTAADTIPSGAAISTLSAKPLREQLWNFVRSCKESIKDPEFEENDYDSIIDDAKNGYLYISGAWPACGCSCESTVGAFKRSDGSYTLLKEEKWPCSSKYSMSSNYPLHDLLPVGFGLQTFLKKTADYDPTIVDGFFFFDVTIPRVGTQTLINLRQVPFGLNARCAGGLCFDFGENSYSEDRPWLIKLIEEVESEESLELLLNDNPTDLIENDRKLLDFIVRDNPGVSWYDFTEALRSMYQHYRLYQQVECTTVVLDWSRAANRFVIKDRLNPVPKLSFLDFLRQGAFYSPSC
jgi:hypothetical protein